METGGADGSKTESVLKGEKKFTTCIGATKPHPGLQR